MAKAKRKQLPKDFETLLKSTTLEQLKSLFDTYDVNARGGYCKQTALAFNECPDKLTRWLVEQGADLAACDSYGDTALHTRSRHWNARLQVLLDLGADVNHGANERGTPLHTAAGSHNAEASRLLLRHGAQLNALNQRRQTPLEYALQQCKNADIEAMAPLAELLLSAGARQTPELTALVTQIGTDFEFHRSGFNPNSVKASSAALEKLYVLFDVPPVAHRVQHDGKSPIRAKSGGWEAQHEELWELLVPSSGAADTVQGEVVRIARRVTDELERNGGGNWDAEYRKMLDAFLAHMASGIALPELEMNDAREAVAELKRRNGDPRRLCELAVNWVALNPKPKELPRPMYKR